MCHSNLMAHTGPNWLALNHSLHHYNDNLSVISMKVRFLMLAINQTGEGNNYGIFVCL